MTHSGDDLLVVNAARTSFAKESEAFSERDAKLIKFLAREGHVLPFRHPSITLRCSVPLFIARQLGKHQVGMSWSEESRRYITEAPSFYIPHEWRKAAQNVKQGSSSETITRLDDSSVCDIDKQVEAVVGICVKAYEQLLAGGVAPELARTVLPQSMFVNFVWTGSLLSFFHVWKLRSEAHAQQEAREFAAMLENTIAPLYPVSWEALKEFA